MQSVTIGGNQAGQRLDKFLHKYLPNAGTGFLYKMLRKKNITLNGRRAQGCELLVRGDLVCFYFSSETFARFSGADGASGPGSADGMREYRRAFRELAGIRVVYEDSHVLILDKPFGILTQKADGADLSLNEWMIGYLLEQDPGLERELAGFRPSVCNRLDRNTSGLVLCGKTLPGLQFLSRCIRERSVKKFYRTVCVGRLEREALLKGYLYKDRERNRVQVDAAGTGPDARGESVRGEPGRGEYIETAYRPICTGREHTLLEVELITGKPHQIRAHLAAEGHPIIGDQKYGDRRINREMRERFGLQHQLLRAFRVEFASTQEPAGRGLSGQVICAPRSELFENIQRGLGLSG